MRSDGLSKRTNAAADAEQSLPVPLDVRYFNEEQSGEYRQLRDNDQFNRVSSGLDGELGDTIDLLEMQMQSTIELLEVMEKKGLKDKADELRKQYGDKLRDLPADDAELAWEVEDDAPVPQLPYLDLNTKTQKERIQALNRFLQLHQDNRGKITPKIASFFWKLYVPSRQALALSWARVPAEAWPVFWAVGSWDKGDNPNRMHHIYVLTQDMQAAGIPLSDDQQLLAIESMFLEGLRDKAIETWKKAVGVLGSRPETFQEYWELGVRMYSLHGDVERAARAANTLLESDAHESDPRILIPLIQAHAEKAATHEQAWESYRRLRDLLGDSMEIEDYDKVIECFLSKNCVDYALQAFVDMMFSGAIDLKGKTKLPAQVANRFFFGKWLKRLIGAQDLDGAYKVVCYMEQRGILAAAIQLNGLLAAWMRTRTADNVEKAEKLGWAMVRSRLMFVDLRRRQEAMAQWPIQLRAVGETAGSGLPQGEEDDAELSYVPAATLETFSLMADNYQKRRLTKRLEELWVAFKQAEIATDGFMMNQMLESYLHDGQAGKVFEFYQTMAKEHGVSPDGFTFLALFKSLSVNRLVVRDRSLIGQDLIQARKIFQDLVRSPWAFQSPSVYEQLPRTILFSFHLMEDYAGMIVAARTMRQLFGFVPSEALLMDLAAGASTQRKTRRPGKKNMAVLIDAGRSIELLFQQRQQEVGRSLGEMTPEEKGDEFNAVLERLILVRARAAGSGAQMLAAVAAAAEKMGAVDIAINPNPETIAECQKPITYLLDPAGDASSV